MSLTSHVYSCLRADLPLSLLQSQASVTDLNAELEKARAKAGNSRDGSSSTLRSLLTNIPGGDSGEVSREMDSMDRIRAGANQPGGKRPEDMTPQELHSVLWQVLTFRDSSKYMRVRCAICLLTVYRFTVVKNINNTIGE